MTKTRKQWIETLPKDIRDRAEVNAAFCGITAEDLSVECHSLEQALTGAFVFSETSEGSVYWWTICTRYEGLRSVESIKDQLYEISDKLPKERKYTKDDVIVLIEKFKADFDKREYTRQWDDYKNELSVMRIFPLTEWVNENLK